MLFTTRSKLYLRDWFDFYPALFLCGDAGKPRTSIAFATFVLIISNTTVRAVGRLLGAQLDIPSPISSLLNIAALFNHLPPGGLSANSSPLPDFLQSDTSTRSLQYSNKTLVHRSQRPAAIPTTLYHHSCQLCPICPICSYTSLCPICTPMRPMPHMLLCTPMPHMLPYAHNFFYVLNGLVFCLILYPWSGSPLSSVESPPKCMSDTPCNF